ncbi:MAG: hypothetical protein KA314_24610 [Chloroflexi bacterium]|nr:hypothetical protein [Chloroflexota bacterium]MBP8059029.1 hypothetical protein [Chloroflexota bacterium]
MGMFDNVICGYSLPGNPPPWVVGHTFQTKDLGSTLDHYTITPDGYLIWHRTEHRFIEDETAVFGFHSELIRAWDEPVGFHGEFNFYTGGSKAGGDYHEGHPIWLEYKARFSNGRLDWILLVEARDIPNMDHDQVQVVWRDRVLQEVGISAWEHYGITEEIAAAYLASLHQHLAAVREAGLKLGVPLAQLDVHDQSKFSLEEFPHYARNFFGDKGDPDGWAAAWLHHIHHNPHHWQHWLFADGYSLLGSALENGVIRMPHSFLLEMVADWMGAAYAYHGSWDMSQWLTKNLGRIRLHSQSLAELRGILAGLGYEIDRLLATRNQA